MRHYSINARKKYTEGNPAYAIDGKSSTWWHTVWSDSERDTHYLIFTFDEVKEIDGMRFQQRSNGVNGVVTTYDLLVRESEDDEWVTVVDNGSLLSTTEWQKVTFDKVSAKQVKFQVVDATSDNSNKFAAVAEIRFTEYHEEVVVPDPTPTPTPTPDINFTDIMEDGFYYDAVLWAVENNITQGTSDTEFSPNKECTRGQVVTFLWRAAGEPEASVDTCKFTDIKAEDYYYEAVLWAVEKGITDGTSDTEFSPDATCTRGQVVTFLWRKAGQPDSATSECRFTDVKTEDYYYKAVLWAVEKGITDGTSDTQFSPDAVCTRGHVVTFLFRDIEA